MQGLTPSLQGDDLAFVICRSDPEDRRQTFNRRIVQAHLGGKKPLSIAFAIPDHPWVDTADGAAVRIAMTVGTAGSHEGELLTVTDEEPNDEGAVDVKLSAQRGVIQADLTAGADVAGATVLAANEGLCHEGIKPHGTGFLISHPEAKAIGLGSIDEMEQFIRPYRNGRDLTDKPRETFIIDFFGLSQEEARKRFPKAFQHLLQNVKPHRDSLAHTKDGAAYAKTWWLLGKPRADMRDALNGLSRYAVTVKTAKHRLFQFLSANILPDSKLIVFALDDAFHLGILSSHFHCAWALWSGGWLGYGNDPTYVKSAGFDKFPFPVCDEAKTAGIRALAEELDAHRKRVQAEHGIGLTDMYNVLEKVRSGEELTTEEKELHDRALISTLKQLHDDLDAAVADAYGWPWPMTDAEILERVVALNKKRADEEARGTIRWLRPDYQKPRSPSRKRPGPPPCRNKSAPSSASWYRQARHSPRNKSPATSNAPPPKPSPKSSPPSPTWAGYRQPRTHG